jgi:hypothetical protein
MSNSTSYGASFADLPEGHEVREETFKEQLWRRMKENPAVPVGTSRTHHSVYSLFYVP